MRFRLWTILWAVALFASGLATFGTRGIVFATAVLLIWALLLKQFRTAKAAILAVLGFTVLVISLYPSGYSSTQLESGRKGCRNNMQQIVLALRGYRQVHGTFPPAYIADKDGRPKHSWRVLILPFIEEKALYDQYNFDEPWDGPNNRKLWDKTPYLYQCPTCYLAAMHGVLDMPAHATNYLALVVPNSIWTGSDPYNAPNNSRNASNGLVLLESAKGICWTEPADASLKDALEQLKGSSDDYHFLLDHGFFALNAYRSEAQLANLNMSVLYDIDEILRTMAESGQISEGDAKVLLEETAAGNGSANSYNVTTAIKWDVVYSFSAFVILSLPSSVQPVGEEVAATRSAVELLIVVQQMRPSGLAKNRL